MMVLSFRSLSLLMVMAFCVRAEGKAQLMDDSASYVVPPMLQMQWRGPLARGRTAHEMEGQVQVNLHIDTRPWAERKGRIYMVLSPDHAADLEAQWSGGSLIMPGKLKPGDRALVFVGSLPSQFLRDRIIVTLRTTQSWLAPQRRIHFHFEFEAD